MAERTEIYEVATDEGLQFCYARNDDSCIIDTIYDTMYNIGGIQTVQMG